MLREQVPGINMGQRQVSDQGGRQRDHVAGTSPKDKYDAETSL